MASGDGVTIDDLGGARWRLRWRIRVRGDDGRPAWRSKEKTILGTDLDAEEMATRIRRMRREADNAGPEPADLDRVLALRAPPANLLDGLLAFIDAREGAGKFTAKTAYTFKCYARRVAAHMHAIHKIPETEGLPVTLLSRETFERIMARDRVLMNAGQRGGSAQVAYASLRLLLDAWRWLADDPDRWAHVPPLPHHTADYLPRTPKYSRTVAPTIAHVDACLRHLPAKATTPTRMLGVFLRYTGLRADTILALERGDIDLGERMLHVRAAVDKNSYDRFVPLADAFVAEIRDWLSLTDEGPIFGKRRHAATDKGKPKKKPTETYKAAWAAATAAGEVPEHVWNPPNRHNARPEHALRAAFDAHLMTAGVPAEVVDYIVGRNEEDVRGRHYGRDLLDAARDAVNRIPPIDWMGPGGAADNVVSLVGSRR